MQAGRVAVVAAEAFTADDKERWLLHPASMKALGDWAFCQGINRIVFHRYAHQPWLDRWPGMTMGPYGIHYERTQTWWELSTAWHAYLSRCQFMLQQGQFVADVCFLAPEGSPHVLRVPASATRGSPPDRLGYNFDGCAPEALLQRMSVQDGRLVLPDGTSYRLLVLPLRAMMTPVLLRKIKALAEAGATVVGPRTVKSPSLSRYPECDREVKTLGKVAVMARVKLNGRDLGVLWKPPFAVEVAGALKPGTNVLAITVPNLWPNRLIGDQSLAPEKRVAWSTWNPFTKDSPLVESGLIGPVTLRAP